MKFGPSLLLSISARKMAASADNTLSLEKNGMLNLQNRKFKKFPKILHIRKQEQDADEAVLEIISGALKKGGVAAVPTDTVYGLATLLPFVESLFEVKGRDGQKPIAICVADVDEIYGWAEVPVPRRLLEALLPGPVTLLLPRKESLPQCLNPGSHTVGVRIPDTPFLRRLCRSLAQPLALTSANLSQASSSLDIQEFSTLWPNLDVILDAGRLSDLEEQRQGSTVVDFSQSGTFRVVRPGNAYQWTMDRMRKCSLNSQLRQIPEG